VVAVPSVAMKAAFGVCVTAAVELVELLVELFELPQPARAIAVAARTARVGLGTGGISWFEFVGPGSSSR
jgi:hypothetical protein